MELADVLAPYPNKAKRLFKEIERKLDLLEDNPYMYPVYHANPKYRRMNLEGHTLLYSVNDTEHEIKICYIMYSQRDIERLINK